jgi:transcriptional regulator with XRE-family HTH domain
MSHAPVQPGIASRGRARRIALGLTATELAARMRLSVPRICQLEFSGATHVDLLARWAAALEMPPGELAFGPDGKP